MIRRLAFALLVIVAATGCATMSVSSHMEPNLTTSNYRTFGWAKPDVLPAGDARLEQNAFFKDHIEGAVEKEFGARGLTMSDTPDLLVHYHAVITPRLDVNRLDRESGYCYDEDCSARVFEYEQGTLVIDIVDAKTKRVIWRGWSQETVAPLLKNQDRMAKDIDTAVQRMLARFPR
ncbi:MAG: DUF4136 domain-containing protein [Vicinamibacterales bacterium]